MVLRGFKFYKIKGPISAVLTIRFSACYYLFFGLHFMAPPGCVAFDLRDRPDGYLQCPKRSYLGVARVTYEAAGFLEILFPNNEKIFAYPSTHD